MMKTILLLVCVVVSIAGAQTSKDLLRDGLFAEESEGDLKTATEKYEALLKAFEKERKVAATALFRLAAVKRKQNDEEGALALYEEFMRKFGSIEPQATLVRENYLALSGKELSPTKTAPSEEDLELARLKKLAVSSPDLFPNLDNFASLATKGWSKAVTFLLEKGADPNHKGVLVNAVSCGNLAMVNLLLKAGADPNHPNNKSVLEDAVRRGHWQICETLTKNEVNLPKLSPGILTDKSIMDLNKKQIDFLITHGADPNHITRNWHSRTSGEPVGIPLHDAVRLGKHQFAKLLLESGAQVDLARESDGIRTLHLACTHQDEEMMKILIAAGADLNSPTLISDDGSNSFPQRYSAMSGQSPLELCGITKTRILIEAGAKLVPDLLARAVYEGDEKLIDYLISKGADPNQKGQYQLPLNLAFKLRKVNMARHLIKSGARFSDANWYNLPPKFRIQYAREFLYPDFAKSSKVTVALPELENKDNFATQIDSGNQSYRDLLQIPFPKIVKTGNNSYDPVDLDSFTWKRIRAGKSEEIDFLSSPLPSFEPGDIVEALGFGSNSNGAAYGKDRGDRLLYTPSKIARNLREAARFPVIITFEGESHDMLICPDKLTFDPRGKELPFGSLGKIFDLIVVGERNLNLAIAPHRISITRDQFPKFTFQSNQSAMNGFELKPHDRIEIISPENPDSNEYPKITARVPGTLGEWQWHIYREENAPDLGPTVLALIADLNSGYQNHGDESADSLALAAMKNSYPLKVLPGIDLSKILVHRSSENGTEQIQINLLEKITQWEKSTQEAPLFDFQLHGGDIVEFSVQEGEWNGFPDKVNQYFETALNFPILNVGSNSSDAISLNFKMPSWHLLDWGYLPISKRGNHSTIRGNHILQGSFKLQRGETDYDLPNRYFYWPKAGDIIKTKPPYRPRPSSANPSASKPKQRIRYVPRPK